jgi:hypothetical protein
MPRRTARGVRIKTLSTWLEEWEEIRIQSLLDESDQDLDDDPDVPNIPVLLDVPDLDGNYYGDDESSDSEPETITLIKEELDSVLGKRYLNRGPYKPADDQWYAYAFTMLTPRRFRNAFRMNRRTFNCLYDAIKDHTVFKSKGRKPQKPVKLQLLIALFHFGGGPHGGSRDRIARQFGVSEGSAGNYIAHVVTALLSLGKDHLQFPKLHTEEHARVMQLHLALFGLPFCLGFIDRSLIPLIRRPEVDGAAYFTRKKFYALNATIICDGNRRILWAIVGSNPFHKSC